MKKFRVMVSKEVEVTLDESKFTDEFMSQFRTVLYPYDSVEDHARHLGFLGSLGTVGPEVEGYGLLKDMGISVEEVPHSTETEASEIPSS